MGNLLRVLNDKGPVPKIDFFVDFEKAEPTEGESDIHSKVAEILVKAPEILTSLRNYKGAGELIREAISNASSEEHQDAAWQAVCPLVSLLKIFYEYALELESALCQLLNCLCSPEVSALQHLEREQAITRQFAEVLHFALSFDEMKMSNPAIQNDFSYYRRTMNRRKMETSMASGNITTAEVPDDVANRMSLFYANPTPMLNTLSGATEKLLQENSSLTLDNTTDCFSTMASVCRVLNENPSYLARLENKDTGLFCLQVMVGVIILYDHIHPMGAFAKKSAIDMKASIKVIKERLPKSDTLINALKYNTKHFNDEATPKSVKDMLS